MERIPGTLELTDVNLKDCEHAKLSARSKKHLGDLLHGFGGLEEPAAALMATLPEQWKPNFDIEALEYTTSSHTAGVYGDRLCGMRTCWQATDPEVLRFTAELLAVDRDMPPPDERVIERLEALGIITERVGKIVARDGVPFPVGEQQIRFFVTLRWRWLFNPLAKLQLIGLRDTAHVQPGDRVELSGEQDHPVSLRHLIGYEAKQATDGAQEKLLTYSTMIHRQNLIALQANDVELFWAVWRRDFCAIRQLSRKKSLDYLVPADRRHKKLRTNRSRLLYGTAIMSELERLFEIFEFLFRNRDVTQEAISDLLKPSGSMAGIHADQTPVGGFLCGAVAHTRYIHPTMNQSVPSASNDTRFRRLNMAIRTTGTFSSPPVRLRKPFSGVPALCFIGIEQQFLPLVAIRMLVQNLKRVEKNFAHRVAHDQKAERDNDVIMCQLAAVIAANVNPKFACAMLGYMNKMQDESDWLIANMPCLISNPKLESEYERVSSEERATDVKCDSSSKYSILYHHTVEKRHNSLVKSAIERIRKLPGVFDPGWTRGFYFEAWLMPDAEVEFLRKCCKHVRYAPNAAKAHKKRIKFHTKTTKSGALAKWQPNQTGLPSHNPVEAVHNQMAPLFRRLQFPELLALRGRKQFQKKVNLFVQEVAKLFPAVTPCTLDPFLNEQIVIPVGKATAEFAVEGLWHAKLVRRRGKALCER